MEKLKKCLVIIVIILVLLLAVLFVYRVFSAKHLDDLNPQIPCEESLIKKADSLAVIPIYLNKSIADNKAWCDYILSFNKTLVMHGVYHTYNEFDYERGEDYVNKGIIEFEKCFGYKPSEFKPPQLAITQKNKKFLEEKFGFKVHTWLSQEAHKVYHCNDEGPIPNWFVNLV